MPKPSPAAPADKVALYEKLVATNPKVTRKGAALPYTSINGNMRSLLTKSGTLTLRLPADEREAFIAKYKSKLTEQYGVVMKEYVDVPDALLKKSNRSPGSRKATLMDGTLAFWGVCGRAVKHRLSRTGYFSGHFCPFNWEW